MFLDKSVWDIVFLSRSQHPESSKVELDVTAVMLNCEILVTQESSGSCNFFLVKGECLQKTSCKEENVSEFFGKVPVT